MPEEPEKQETNSFLNPQPITVTRQRTTRDEKQTATAPRIKFSFRRTLATALGDSNRDIS